MLTGSGAERKQEMEQTKRAILVVSFGTSYADTCRKTIEQIENDIRDAYPQYRIYRAWTSGMIRRKLLKRDGVRIFDVKEAMEQMHADGITQVVVQPTHVINGIENDRMTADVHSCEQLFEHVVIGTPLLTSREDNERVIRAVAEELHPSDEETVVLMGHGTEHFSNSIYAALDYQFKDMGYSNIFMGTVESYPSFDTLMRQMSASEQKRLILAPFMIVAGDHATNDLAGEEDDSWKNQFEQAGFSVQCVLKGLGEYPAIRQVLLEHTRTAVKKLEEQAA